MNDLHKHDDILFEIGLWPKKANELTERNFIHNPLVIISIIVIMLTERIMSVAYSDNTMILNIVGDIGHYFVGTYVWSGIFILYSTMALNSIIMYYYNYYNNINPSFIKILHQRNYKYCLMNLPCGRIL